MQVNVVGGLSAGAGVSGNPVVVSSGNINVQSGVWLASGIVVNISGQNVTASVNTTTNVSGQQIYLGSGSNYVTLSGATVTVAGGITVSGQPVAFASGAQLSLSGVAVFISGGVSTSGSAVGISGQAVTVSGNYINIASGSIAGLSGTPIGISGQTISLLSGIYLASGINVIASVSVATQSLSSGNVAVLSGSITVNSGTVSVSGLYQANLSFESGIGGISGAIPTTLLAFDLSGSKWNPLSVSNSGTNNLNVNIVSAAIFSGLNVTVGSGALALVSGDISVLSGLITLGSGANNVGTFIAASGVYVASGIIPNISGQAVSISGNVIQDLNMGAPTMVSGFGYSGNALPTVNSMWDFSGQAWVPLSSVTSGNNSALGVAQQTASQIRIGLSGTAVQSGLPNSSGGTALQSGDLYVITVRNVSGNNDMYIGGSGAKPFSGFGFVLCGGDALTMSITNANLVYVYATTSGQFVKWIGSQY